ncbi:MAG: DUF805 domain-containing protein [Pirellulales bacterium]|nr:DUF805 domain-containing protein [Pirellulales bacterium]
MRLPLPDGEDASSRLGSGRPDAVSSNLSGDGPLVFDPATMSSESTAVCVAEEPAPADPATTFGDEGSARVIVPSEPGESEELMYGVGAPPEPPALRPVREPSSVKVNTPPFTASPVVPPPLPEAMRKPAQPDALPSEESSSNEIAVPRLSWLLFSFDDRIPRTWFWLGFLVAEALAGIALAALALVSLLIWETVAVPKPLLVTWLLVSAGPLTWIALAVSAKRYHDRDKPGWWSLVGLVPVVGWIWALIETGCLPGTPGPNRFGAEPESSTS